MTRGTRRSEPGWDLDGQGGMPASKTKPQGGRARAEGLTQGSVHRGHPFSFLDSQGLLDSSLMASGTASRSEDEESLAGQKRASSQALGTIPKRRSSSR
jgi:hypothetical protein